MKKKQKYNDKEIVDLLTNGSEREINRILFYLMDKHKNDFYYFAYKRSVRDDSVLSEIWQDVIYTFYKKVQNREYQYQENKIKSYLFDIGKLLILKKITPQNIKYKISEKTYQRLEDESISDGIIQKISALEGKTFQTQKALKEKLKTLLNKNEIKKYQKIIIESSKQFPPKITDDFSEVQNQTFEKNIELTEDQTILKEEIKKLGKKCNELLTKNRFEGIKYKALAKEYNTTLGTIQNSIHRCLGKLRKQMKKKYTEDDFK